MMKPGSVARTPRVPIGSLKVHPEASCFMADVREWANRVAIRIAETLELNHPIGMVIGEEERQTIKQVLVSELLGVED